MSDRFPNGGPPAPWEPPRPPQKRSGMPTWAKVLLITGTTILMIMVAIPVVIFGLIWFACSSH